MNHPVNRKNVRKTNEQRKEMNNDKLCFVLASLSKASMKQKKKREAKKAKKQENAEAGDVNNEEKVSAGIAIVLTGDVEKDKKIKNLKKVC